MMYSDYYAISSCAFSVVFLPFMILTQMRMTLVLQAFNYRNGAFMRWLWCSQVASLTPLLLICAEVILAQMCLGKYLTTTSFTELGIIVVYAAWLLLAAITLAMSFARYIRVMGGAMWNVPRIADRHAVIVFIGAALADAALALASNMSGWRAPIYFFPIIAPFLVPLVNLFLRPFPGRVEAVGGGTWEDEA